MHRTCTLFSLYLLLKKIISRLSKDIYIYIYIYTIYIKKQKDLTTKQISKRVSEKRLKRGKKKAWNAQTAGVKTGRSGAFIRLSAVILFAVRPDGCGGIRDPWAVGVAIGVTYLCCEPAECGQ